MKNKKIWNDLSFWILILANGYLVYYYYRQPTIFTTLIWLYWAQSVMLGAINILDILTVRKVNTHEQFKSEGKMVTTSFTRRVPSALFFMLHYGFFHAGYFVFLLTMKKSGPVQWDFFRYFLYAFLAGQIITFVQHKIQQQKEETSLSRLFATPYIRIIPMHFTIILSGFMATASMGIFLVLKSLCDVIMYIVTKPKRTGSRDAEAAQLAAHQGMNM